MTITKALLTERLAELAAAKDKLIAELNAIIGAQQAYRALLTDLDADATPEGEARRPNTPEGA